jgi:hypothetical protein
MVLCVVLFSVFLSAQTAPPRKNPTSLTFESADHSKVSGYEVDILTAAGAVLQTVSVGKGTQDAAGVVTVTIPVQPLAFGSYTVRARAVATVGPGTFKSADSTPSEVWERVPAQPFKVTVQ